jgi:glutamyl-tRNA reductase
LEKAEALAKQYNATAIPLSEKRKMLEFTDVLICATSAPHTLVKQGDIPTEKEMLIFDLAFPRDVEPALADKDGIRLFDLEDIEQFAQNNIYLRNNEIKDVEQIIEEEIDKFHEWSNHPQYVY